MKFGNFRLRQVRFFGAFCLTAAAALSVGCDGDQPPGGKLLSDTPEKADATAEEERIRQMQLLRVVGPNGPTDWTTKHIGALAEPDGPMPDDTFYWSIRGTCNGQMAGCDPGDERNSIRFTSCQGARLKCQGELLQSIVTDPSSVQLYAYDRDQGNSGLFTVLPQTAATNALLAEVSAKVFAQAVRWITNGIGYEDQENLAAYLSEPSPMRFTDSGGDFSVGAHLGSMLVDSFYKGKESFELAVDNTLAVSDAELASTPAFKKAKVRAISKRALSRMAAAHLLVGGKAGYKGSETDAFCTSGRLSGPAEAALGLLREAGVAPADVMDPELTTRALVDGPDLPIGRKVSAEEAAGKPTKGSVKARLGNTWGRPLAANQSIFTLYSLEESDFDAARRELVDQITVFNRSLTATLSPRPAVDGVAPAYARYAATATLPQERDPSFWSAIAMTDSSDPEAWKGADDWYSWRGRDDKGAATNLADFVDFALDSAGEVFENSWLRDLSDAEVEAEVQSGLLAPLSTLLHDRDRLGRLTQCNFRTSVDPNTWVTVAGFKASDGLRYVFGDEVMQCATKGNIDGAPCAIAEGELHSFEYSSYDVAYNLNGATAVTTKFPRATAPYGQRIYVLKPRLLGNTNAVPGRWETLVGTPLYGDYGGQGWCRDVPIVAEASKRVGEIMAPSAKWCGASTISCAGGRFDERLPLEDELSSDQDGVESSWKHYLSLARNAATESDRLGEEYISASLAVDERDETLSLRARQQQEQAAGELEALQDICGTAIDPAPLLKLIGENPNGEFNLNSIDYGACTGTPPTTLPAGAHRGAKCKNGRALLSWTKLAKTEPELKDLAKCISDFSDTTTTTYGDAEICAWTDDDGTICSPVAGYKCPDIKHGSVDEDGRDVSICLTPPGKTEFVIPTDDALKLFATVESMAPTPKESLCDNVRVLRRSPAGQDTQRSALLKELVDSNHFDMTLLQTLRGRVELRAKLGGYVDLVIDSKTAFSTGSVKSGPSDKWPCTEVEEAANCDVGDGLFCWHGDCSSEDGRKTVAERLFRTVAAAQLTTFGGGEDPNLPMWLPLYLQHGAKPARGIGSPLTWSAKGDAPFTKTSNDRWELYTGDFDFDTFRLFDGVWKPTASESRRFAIGSVGAVSPPAWRPKFWGGFSHGQEGTGKGEPQYLLSVLANGPTGVPNPASGTTTAYGSDLTVDEGCSDSCWLSYQACGATGGFLCGGCDCYGNSDSHKEYINEDLKDYQLETDNYNGKVIKFIDVQPVTYDYTDESILDGLELLCEVSEGFGERATACPKGAPPSTKSVEDLSRVGSYLKCVADDISNSVAVSILPDFPRAALDPLKTGIVPPKGDIGTAVSQLRSALLRVAAAGPTIARTIRDFGLDMKRLRETIAIYDINDQIGDVQFESTVMEQSTACIAKAADEVGRLDNKWTFGATAIAATAATCLNSAAQIGFASKLNSLNEEKTKSERALAVIDFNERFSGHSETLEKQSIELADAMEEVQRQLGFLEDLHAKAQKKLDKALWLLSFQAANQAEVSNVLAGRSKTAEIRYRRAFTNAKRLAFLAGRAVEQRLGVNLAEMTEELPLVAAPATWAPAVCTTTGIDYGKLRKEQAQTSPDTPDPGSYADAYIGEYITKLENVVESYRLTQNFHEGSDTAVVSLRDDVFGLKANCKVESPNLLYWSSSLDRLALVGDPQRVGWGLKGCALDAAGNALSNCITVTQHAEAPFVDLRPQLRTVPGFTVQFGDGGNCPAATCGYRSGAAIVQTVSLTPGRYRFSWYTKEGEGSASTLSGFVRNAAGNLQRIAPDFVESTPWGRPYFLFDVAAAGDYEVGFEKPAEGTATSVVIGAPMLEQIDGIAGQISGNSPKMYSATTGQRTSTLAVCQDTDGKVFRSEAWTRGCTFLCPDGYSTDCRDKAKRACYWETSIHVSQRAIEAGHQFKHSGFARGNFNYRVDTLGLNFVGTGLRACEGSESPLACYAGGFIPYSIVHAGPYYVRNHRGTDYEAKLFTGLIEHARGLATERYVTNPMSDADRSLITPYFREELQGRPLDGDYVLRVWDEEGVEFNRIEDVQLVLNYRYWTRFN